MAALCKARRLRWLRTALALRKSRQTHSRPAPRCSLALAALTGAGAFASQAFADTSSMDSSDWRFRGSVYGFFAGINSKADFPFATTGIDVNSGDIITNLNFTFMGAFEAQKRRFGIFTDLIYIDFSSAASSFRQFRLGGGIPLPAGVNIDADLGVKMTMWTIAGEYRIYESPSASLDILAGARLHDSTSKLGFKFNVDVGPFSGPNRQGEIGVSVNNWDGIIGAKGRYRFGDKRNWFLTGYGDMGAGDSDFTWQAFAGLGRSFGWLDVTAGWRHVAYDLASGSAIKTLAYDGPIAGVSFSW